MLRNDFLQVREAADADAYRAALVSFAHKLDFSTVTAVLVIERIQQAPKVFTVGNPPDAYVNDYYSNEDSLRDPVWKRIKKLNHPIIWDQQTYVDGGAADLWERQAPFDYHTGVQMALHMPNGRHFYLGVDRRAHLPADEDQLTRMMADLQLLGVYAQDAAQRLFEHVPVELLPALTDREKEVLQWTLLGKSAWAIARILEVSENTVHWHAQRALRKLDCENKHSAALKARDLGLL